MDYFVISILIIYGVYLAWYFFKPKSKIEKFHIVHDYDEETDVSYVSKEIVEIDKKDSKNFDK